MRSLNLYSLTQLTLLTSLCITVSGCQHIAAGTSATGAVVALDRRTTGTIIEDKSIQLKVAKAIQVVAQDHPSVKVNAVSYNNRVVLIGQVPSKKLKRDIEETVSRIKKIHHLHNEITVSTPVSTKIRSTDAMITAKIKGEMTITRNINPTRIKVLTEDNIVYLMGIVTPGEEQIAVDIARHTRGVRKVVKIFEYDNA